MHGLWFTKILSVMLWAIAVTCSVAGGVLACRHPTGPILALTCFYALTVAAIWWPRAWLFAVPACLPFLNFAPWTGWLVFEELDLLLL